MLPVGRCARSHGHLSSGFGPSIGQSPGCPAVMRGHEAQRGRPSAAGVSGITTSRAQPSTLRLAGTAVPVSGAYPLGHGSNQAVAPVRPGALLPLADCCGDRWRGLGNPPLPQPSLTPDRSRSCRAIRGPQAGATRGQDRPSRTVPTSGYPARRSDLGQFPPDVRGRDCRGVHPGVDGSALGLVCSQHPSLKT